MAATLAGRLSASPDSVSLKAKTNEGMGFIGRGEGVAVIAVVHAGGPLIESLLGWVSQLPPGAVYTVLALLAAIENVIPPVPSDAAVALGAFLTNRGLTTPIGVFLVTWLANLAGAAAVYLISRRYGRRLFATNLGRRLLAPRSLAIIEREYLRFGVAGIFVSRFLPGIRAVVPPFAGLIHLSAVRTLVPMGVASAIWYGSITVLGSVIGAEWGRINHILAGSESNPRHRCRRAGAAWR